MDLKILEKKIGNISINFEEVKEAVQESVKKYESLVFTDEQITEATKERTELNNKAKLLDEHRKVLKKEFMKPFEETETQLNELIKIYNTASSYVDKQVKDFEAKRRNEKKNEVVKLWETKEFIYTTLEMIFDERWLNKTVTMKQVENEMNEKIAKISNDLVVLNKMVSDPFELKTLQGRYLVNFDLAKTIADFNQEKEAQERMTRVNKVETLAVSEPSITTPKKTEQPKQEEVKYTVAFTVTGTKEQIQELQTFLEKNKFEWRV